MKHIYILLLFISSVCFSQELFLGKTANEIIANTNHRTYSMILNNKQSICEIVDTNITDVYCFNTEGICIEYNRLFSNIGLEVIQSYLREYNNNGNVWVNSSDGLVAIVSEMPNNLYKISIRKLCIAR